MTDAERALLRQEVEMTEQSQKVHKWNKENLHIVWTQPISAEEIYQFAHAYAESRLAAARAGERWIPVTERLPPTGKLILVVWDGQTYSGLLRSGDFTKSRAGKWYVGNHPCNNVTHWRPLPSPPAESETNEKT